LSCTLASSGTIGRRRYTTTIAPAYFTLALASLASAVVFWLLPAQAGASLTEAQR